MKRPVLLSLAFSAVAGLACTGHAAEKLGLKKGDVELKSAGPMTFGPEGILFVGDPKAATIYAIDTGEALSTDKAPGAEADNLQEKVAKAAGVAAGKAQIVDLAVMPYNGAVFLSISAEGKAPTIARVTASGDVEPLSLKGVANSSAALPNAPEDKVQGEGRRAKNPRNESITDLAWVNGQVIVSGLRAADAPSSVETIEFPFSSNTQATSLEIYHGAHGRVENAAPIRVFVPFNINGEPHLLAGFTCTPLVKFPVAKFGGEEKVRGTTVAELGNHNQPLDMIAYEKDGETFLLSANSARGVMKISTQDIAENEGISAPVPDGNTAGQGFETVDELTGVVQLDKLDDSRAVVLVKDGDSLTVKTIELP